LEIEKEWGKFDYRGEKGKILRVVQVGEKDVPFIKLSKTIVIDLTEKQRAKHLFTDVQNRYRKLSSKKMKVNLELEKLEERKENLYKSIKDVEPEKLLKLLKDKEKSLEESINSINEIYEKINEKRKILSDSTAKNNEKIKEVFYKLGVNIETAAKWYLEGIIANIPKLKERSEELKPFLEKYIEEKQLEYLEKYFYLLSAQQKEKLSRTESCIAKLEFF
jgi:predicted  nucleic acid-binding Zn-ribbon protein